MNQFCTVALIALAVASPASAGVDVAFGNTILSTYPDGRTARLWLEPDGAYSGTGRRKLPSSGRWTLKGDRICLKQLKPTRAPIAFCTPVPNGKIGTTWTAKAATGETIQVKVVPGKV